MEVSIGRVVKAHGIRGEVAVEVTTDNPEKRFGVDTVLEGRQGSRSTQLTVTGARPHKGRLLLSFAEIADRTEAESLRGMKFFAEADDESDGYYDHDLEGLNVVLDDVVIGQVTGVIDTANRSVLEIRLDASHGDKEVLVPFVEEFVPEVDLAAEQLTITPPEGLLDL